ncbi:MAG: TlpA family protein disulfide reductase [Proteobacteria bacterium]|nr:TlpA family protein disulfide reductase [Pseudomonadota bacterium]
MAKLLKWIPLWILAAIALCACNKSHAVIDSQNQQIKLSDWRNKWVIINYWAGWCESCVQEIPELNSFYQKHQKNIVLVGVNQDNLPKNQLIAAIKQLHIQYPVLQTDPAKILALPAVQVLPTTFIINPKGQLVKVLLGPQSTHSLEDIINGKN